MIHPFDALFNARCDLFLARRKYERGELTLEEINRAEWVYQRAIETCNYEMDFIIHERRINNEQ